MTFDELVEPIGDERNRDNGTGDPQKRPDGGAVPRRQGVVHHGHQQWLHAVYSKVYATQSKVNELENRQIESFGKLLKKLILGINCKAAGAS